MNVRKHVTPSFVLALAALFVSLSGTAVAAGVVPLARKAQFATNAGKLQGRTAPQVAAIPGPATSLGGRSADEIARTPGPATTLEGKTLAEVAALPGPATTLEGKSLSEVAALPGPASTAAGLVTIVNAPFTIPADGEGNYSASCPAGSRVLSGGYAYSGSAFVPSLDTRPTSATTWTIYLGNGSSQPVTGAVYAVCLG